MRLTLLVPELIWPEPNDQFTLGKLALPGFEWLAARASFTRQPRQAFENILARQFGLSDAPFGSLRLLGEGKEELASSGHWLCADPVHLRFHHERIVLADAGAFDLDVSESEALVASLNQEFSDVGVFHITDARRWYLRLNATVNQKFEPISAIAGRRLDGELSDKNGPLTRWLNEIQMYLHGHPVNEQRQATGKPAINSLWLWGGGSLPRPSMGDFSTVWSDNPLAIGLAQASGLAQQGLPPTLADVVDQAADAANHLLILDSLLPPVLYEDGEAWKTAWQNLDRDWFAPLRQALGSKVSSLHIVAPTIYGELSWTMGGKDHWKFWRKGQPLSALARQLAEGNPL